MLLDEFRNLKNIGTSSFGLFIQTLIFKTDHWGYDMKKKLIERDRIETLYQENFKLFKLELLNNEIEFDPKIFEILISMVRLITIQMTCKRYQKDDSELRLSLVETDWIINLSKVVKETFSFEFGDQEFNHQMEKLRLGECTQNTYFLLKNHGQRILKARLQEICKKTNIPYVSIRVGSTQG